MLSETNIPQSTEKQHRRYLKRILSPKIEALKEDKKDLGYSYSGTAISHVVSGFRESN